MQLWDYHTHHSRCHHAIGCVEDYIHSAIQKRLLEIGIADHFPMKLIPEEANVWQYAMEKEEFPIYLKEVENLREQYKDHIIIKIASEVDFYPPAMKDYKTAVSPYLAQLDYIIGSIHVIYINGRAWGIDNEDNPEGLGEFGVDTVYKTYYDQQIQLVKTGFYDIIGHMDLPKKYGIRPNDKEAVFEYQLRLLDELARSDMAMEINTSGFLKPVKEQYPEERVIKEAIDRDIPITLGSDSHDPKNIAYNFDIILAMIKKMGLTHLCKISKRQKELVPIK